MELNLSNSKLKYLLKFSKQFVLELFVLHPLEAIRILANGEDLKHGYAKGPHVTPGEYV